MKNLDLIKNKRLKLKGIIYNKEKLNLYIQIKDDEYYKLLFFPQKKYIKNCKNLQIFYHITIEKIDNLPNTFDEIPCAFMLLKLSDKKEFLELKTIKTKSNAKNFVFENGKIIIPSGHVLLKFSKFGDNYCGQEANGYCILNKFYLKQH